MRLILIAAILLAHATPGYAHGTDLGGADNLGIAIVLLGVGFLYARGAAGRVGSLQSAAFATGWLALLAALLSPLDTAADRSFSWHMVQHELLMIMAPPLLVLGKPFSAFSASLPATAVRWLALPLRIPPPAAFAIHAAALWLWHVPALFDLAVADDSVHLAQHASFFASALLFWWAVFRRLRSGSAVLYVLATVIHTGVLGALLTFAPAPLYAGTALDDQQLGGLIMWVPAGYALVLAGLLAFNRWIAAHA